MREKVVKNLTPRTLRAPLMWKKNRYEIIIKENSISWTGEHIEIAHVRKTATQHGFNALLRFELEESTEKQISRRNPNREGAGWVIPAVVEDTKRKSDKLTERKVR